MYVAINPKTGCYLREATTAEAAQYEAQPYRSFPNVSDSKLARLLASAFFKPIMVGEVLVDEDNGPGLWFGGAGF